MSWEPVNLRHVPDDPPEPPDYLSIVYRRRRHWFSGPPESLKTLVAYAILLEAVRRGERVALIDFEMGERDAKARLQEMGATGDDFDLIEFYEPEGPPTKATLQEIGERCEVVVVDAAAGAYQMYGLDENRDAEKFNARMPDVLWRAGATCIVLDHVVKNREARGMWASGHHRKIGGTEVHIGFDAIPKLERGGVGRAIMTRHKDRVGFHKSGKGNVGTVEFTSRFADHSITWVFMPSDGESNEFRPTVLMARASLWLSEQDAPANRTEIEQGVRHTGTKASNDALREALRLLVKEGYARESEGSGNAKPLQHVRLFTPQSADSPESAESPPRRGESRPADSPNLLQGGGERRRTQGPTQDPPTTALVDDALQAEADRLEDRYGDGP